MSLSKSTPQDPHVLADHAAGLDQIYHPGVNLAIWRRQEQPNLKEELACLPADQLPDTRVSAARHSFEDDIVHFLTSHGLDPSSLHYLLNDLRLLFGLFFEFSGDREVKFRLFTTDQDDCRRFHVDYRHLRLLCTYIGPGTEWLTNMQVDRVAYENGSGNEKILRFGEPKRLESFWVGLMKDDAYPGNEGNGLVHRSPPLAGTGRKRVMLCLDAAPKKLMRR